MGRFALACTAFLRILRSADAAARWQGLGAEPVPTEPKPLAAPPAEPPPAQTPGISPDAVYTLVLLQREGRLVDFLREDIADYSDAQVGAAVRQIHAGCRKVLEETFGVRRIHEGPENAPVPIPEALDRSRIRLIGKPGSEDARQGTLRHSGWEATRSILPRRHEALNPAVIAPAEIEVG